ncbi:MAG: hypothetical protein HDR05_07250 [Lachnospiraceae bacterium]|nr:hypothetical protein [Lachnospiraceae bacterium]
MSISGIGSQNTYIYNSQTKRLSTKDGSKDAFVDYFNGEISADDADSLNGFDARRKGDIETMIEIWSSEEKGNIFNDPTKTEFEITAKDIDAAESSYYIDGKRAFTGYHCGFFQCIDQAELSKAFAEELFKKYKQAIGQKPDISSVNDTSQTVATEEKTEGKRNRFGIPAWLENKALSAYEEWLYRPLSERKSAGSQKQ